jgi:hypothetical protein
MKRKGIMPDSIFRHLTRYILRRESIDMIQPLLGGSRLTVMGTFNEGSIR